MAKKETKKKMSLTVKLLAGVAILAGIAVVGYSVTTRKMPVLTSIAQSGGERTVAAVVNGEEITVEEIRAHAQKVPQLAELPFEMIYPRLLESFINTRMMLRGAEKAGLENDPHVKEVLKTGREQVLAQTYMAKQLETMVTPEQLKEVYIREIQNFERPEEVHARHILVKTEQEAKDILIQLKAGADFKLIATQKSLDQTPDGDLGYFKAEEMIPEFSKPVFALKKGQYSKPIQTPFGWHIVIVDDRRLAAPPSFEEVKDQLKNMYMEQHIPQVLEQERQKAKVEIKVPSLTPESVVTVTEPATETKPAEVPAASTPETPETPAEK